MKRIEQKLKEILEAEITVYEDILFLEEEKGRAILKKAGRLITDLSVRQESLINEIDQLEGDRIAVTEECGMNMALQPSEPLTLKEIARSLGDERGGSLVEAGANLKNLLVRINEKQSANARMINDNIDFFNLLIEDLKNHSTIKSGYNRDGSENRKAVNPVLFNIRA